MEHFAFVSGSETTCDAWNLVRGRLQALGHTSCIHGLDKIAWAHGVQAGIQALADRIGNDHQTILVGHSIAGLFLPALGEALGITSQVYIAALIPQPEKSVFDRILMGEEIFLHSWTEGYEEMRRSADPRTAHRSFLEQHLFHDCAADCVERYWMQTCLPLREIYETVYPAPSALASSHFIVCAGDRTLHPAAQEPSEELLSFARVSTMETGHCPHLAAPASLTNLILSCTATAHP